ncbi:MAG: thiamine pyrophosphate-requiring protein [Betaproteobacteria bacterium]|nr:thiamine pyrophosphate-requiring protein [Betaproteobacteria bacterium]
MKRDSLEPAAAGVIEIPAESAAEAYLALLKQRGVDYLYINAGTDTAPLVEAYARAPAAGLEFPTPIIATHENLAVGMAHGYTMITGRPQVVMLHVSVGAANAVCAVMNAARSQIPMLFTAGRTPLFESGKLGSRDNGIHWAQEMFDQAGMMRELIKWDYELRDALNLENVVDRALGITQSHPRGPVYLTLPREVMAQKMDGFKFRAMAPAVPAAPHPDPEAVRRVATALASARFPVIACGTSGADPLTVPMLVDLADRFGIGVVESRARNLNFPSSHTLHLGQALEPLLADVDALLVLESDVPWFPHKAKPRADAFVAQAGTDPLFNRYPIRSFPSHVSLTTSVAALLPVLSAALAAAGAESGAAERRAHLAARSAENRKAVLERGEREAAKDGPITKMFFTRTLDALRPRDAIIVNEYSALREHLSLDQPGSYFPNPVSAGLGWGLPAALGVQQALPDRTVIAVQGDGAYIFANPAACHHAAALHKLPVLTLVFNNARWAAVHMAADGMYPGEHAMQHAAQHGTAPLSSLAPMPDFEKYVEASGGYGERVETRAQLGPAIERALAVVKRERRQALLNIIGK